MPPNAESTTAESPQQQSAVPTTMPNTNETTTTTYTMPPPPSPEEWAKQLQASVDLVPKLINILRSRGLPSPSSSSSAALDHVDFTAMEKYLGCPLPADYKALIRALPDTPTAWGLDPFYLFRPDEMLHEMQQLRTVCHGRADYNGVCMKPEEPLCFVPFGNSTSAFYVGWIKTHGNYALQPWELVVLDSKNHFDYEPGEGMWRPLVDTLYRMVVRAVTPQVWALRGGYGAYRASYFWHSEEESDEADLGITRYARDGSQDHAASHAERIVVLGRPVCFLGGSDPDEPRRQDTSHLERNDCFKGCSPNDFMGVGVYNLDHPIDIQVEQEEKRLREAPREDARVSLDGCDKVRPERWPLITHDDEFRHAVHKATLLRRRIAVGDRWSMMVGANGQLAMVDTSNQRLWWNTTANNMLETDERFIQVDLAGCHGVALTSKGRIMTIRGFPPTYTWRTFDKLRKDSNFPMDFVKVSAGENAAAALTKEGRIVYWGSVATTKGGVTRVTVQEPFFVPNMIRIVDINLMGRGLCILHSSGRVSLITKRDGLRVIDSSHKVVAVYATGDHVLMLNNQGAVYGLGDRANGQLPVAVTNQTIQDHEEAKAKYESDIQAMREKLIEFRRLIVGHCSACDKCKDKQTQEPEVWEPLLQDGVYTNLAQITHAHGVVHTPDNCGALAVPDDLKQSPLPPVHPTEAGGHAPLKDPTLLCVGKAHKEAIESDETVKVPSDAWNAVMGPYGCEPGSFDPVTAMSGMSVCTVFLHTDGTLSACGDGKPLCTGLLPPGATHSNASYSGRKWGNIGIPLAVRPLGEDNPKFSAVAVGRAGILAVQDNGQVWGCGDSVGTPDSTELLEKLVVLR